MHNNGKKKCSASFLFVYFSLSVRFLHDFGQTLESQLDYKYEPVELHNVLQDDEHITGQPQVKHCLHDVPVVVLGRVDQQGEGNVENSHHEEYKHQQEPVEKVHRRLVLAKL